MQDRDQGRRVIGPISGHDHLMATFGLWLFYHSALYQLQTALYFSLWYRENSFVTFLLRSRDLTLCLRCIEVDTGVTIILLHYYRGFHFLELFIGARYV